MSFKYWLFFVILKEFIQFTNTMKKISRLTLFFLFMLQYSYSQVNLVPNGGFDSVDCVAKKLYDWKFTGFGLPFNECFPLGFSPGNNLKPPFINPNPWSYSDCYQFAHSGKGYSGIEVYGGRGYAAVVLKEELKQYTPLLIKMILPNMDNYHKTI